MGCVYIATCLSTEKYYIGKTIKSLNSRWSDHKSESKSSRDGCTYFHKAIRKYGKENFIVEKLYESENDEDLKNIEMLWIRLLNSQESDIGFNLTAGGDGNSNPSEDRRKQMRDQMLGNTFRLGLVPSNKGIPHSPEQIRKLKDNYWEKRQNADDIKNMLRSQTGNRKGKKKPVPAFRICNICRNNKTHGTEYRCRECNRTRIALVRKREYNNVI
jgi:group I intron endonuclease